MAERGHTYEDILASINARKPDFTAYIEIQKQYADIVIQVLPTQLIEDKEAYFYQTGIFYTHRASAINFRAQESKIITDDCEFMSHYLL